MLVLSATVVLAVSILATVSTNACDTSLRLSGGTHFSLYVWVRDCSENRIFGFKNRKIIVEHTAETGVQTTQQG